MERGHRHAARRVKRELRRGEVQDLVEPLRQPAEEEAEQRPADPRTEEKPGSCGEDGERREVHEDQRGCPPAQSRQEAEDEESPAPSGVRDEDRMGREQAEIAQEDVRHVIRGHEAPLREEQGRHGEDREPEEGRRAVQEPPQEEPRRPEDQETDAVGVQVERDGRASGDREPGRQGIPGRRSEVFRPGGDRKRAGEQSEGRGGRLRLIPVEGPVKRRDEPEGSNAGAEEEQERGECQERRPSDPRGDRIGTLRRHSPRRGRGSGISMSGLHAARSLAAGSPPSVCCGSGRGSGMTGRWPDTR